MSKNNNIQKPWQRWLRPRARDYVNGWTIEYQRRWKRWAVMLNRPYEVRAVFERRGQAYRYALTHFTVQATRKLFNGRYFEQIQNLPLELEIMAKQCFEEAFLENYRKPRKKKQKSQKTIENEIKTTTATSNDV
jgi:hypothetical protein